jgi:ribokinase
MTIAVIGSIHVDFYIKTPKFPQPDETVLGKEFAMYPGGKGANQAVGCARLGVRTYMLSAVGDDFFGKIMVENLSKNNVVIDYIYVAKGVHTGVAFIILNEVSKENMIIVAPGADEAITPDYVENTLSSLTPRAVLAQLEIPIQTVYKTLEIGKKVDAITVLNPSPVKYLSSEIYKYVDVIIPNRVELQQLSGIEVRTEEDVFKAGECLLSRGVKVVVATLGARGAAVITYDKKKIVEAFKVDVVDTVGAGDAFAAGLAVALVEGRDIEEAVRFANAVAALKVTRMGAQSMPYREEVEKFLKKYLHQ